MSGAATVAENGLRFREARRPVNLTARMRTERGWCDIVIRNVSSGGFMAQCTMPPRRGYYVEVWRGELCIVGCVAWCTGSRFGVRSRSKIDIPALVAKRSIAPAGIERRRDHRRPGAAPPSSQVQASRSRNLGRALEFAALGAAAGFAAFFMASAVGELLSVPLADAKASLMEANARATTEK